MMDLVDKLEGKVDMAPLSGGLREGKVVADRKAVDSQATPRGSPTDEAGAFSERIHHGGRFGDGRGEHVRFSDLPDCRDPRIRFAVRRFLSAGSIQQVCGPHAVALRTTRGRG